MPCSNQGSKEELHRKYHPNNHITEIFDGAEENPGSEGPDELPTGKGK